MRVNMLGLLVAAAITSLISTANAGLIVTGVFDGPQSGGEPKVVELYATADIADLGNYGLGAANNGGGTDGVELVLSGSASAGDFIYVIEDDNFDGGAGSLGDGFNDYFGFTPSQLFDGSFGNGGAASVNGDDAVEVFWDATGAFSGAETVVDTFGDIGLDGTGQPWDYLDGWAYRNDNTGPDGATFTIGNWTFSGTNVNDGQTSNATATTPFPIGTYSVVPEPTSIVMLAVGLMAVVSTRRK